MISISTCLFGLTFCQFVTAIVLIISVIVGSIALGHINNATFFKATTHFEKIYEVTDPLSYKYTYPVPCTNKSLGDLEMTYTENTEFGHNCPISEIPCTESFCGSDGYCAFKKASNAGCLFDSECPGISPSCSMCQCQELPLCNGTYGCDQPDWNQCLISVCDGGFECMTVKDPLVECADINDCNPGEDCIDCSCIARNATEISITPINNCTVYENVMGNLVEVLAPNATTWGDEFCVQANGEGWFMNLTTCECYQQTILDVDSGTFTPTISLDSVNSIIDITGATSTGTYQIIGSVVDFRLSVFFPSGTFQTGDIVSYRFTPPFTVLSNLGGTSVTIQTSVSPATVMCAGILELEDPNLVISTCRLPTATGAFTAGTFVRSVIVGSFLI